MKLADILDKAIPNRMAGMLDTKAQVLPGPNGTGPNLAGHDAGSRVAGNSLLPSGIPRKQRNRKFLGVNRNLQQ